MGETRIVPTAWDGYEDLMRFTHEMLCVRVLANASNCWGFRGSPVVKTSLPDAGNSIPGWGAKIPHASWPKIKNIKQKQYCNKFNKAFINGKNLRILQD